LAANALRVLDHIGVYQTIERVGYNFEQMKIANSSWDVLGTISSGNVELFHYPALRMWRSDLRAVLIAECETRGIRIIYGKKLVGLKEYDKWVTIEFEDGTEEMATLVIGCDGSHSIVQKSVSPTTKTKFSGFHLIYGTMPRAVFQKHLNGRTQDLPEPVIASGKEGSFAACPIEHNGNDVSFFFSTTSEDRSRDEWAKLSCDKERLREILIQQYCTGGWSKDVEILIRETKGEDFISWP
jgi:2-polyprenyl-6-methoxyphenol hydroxylase-like FAD-dependent oxidoreductase